MPLVVRTLIILLSNRNRASGLRNDFNTSGNEQRSWGIWRLIHLKSHFRLSDVRLNGADWAVLAATIVVFLAGIAGAILVTTGFEGEDEVFGDVRLLGFGFVLQNGAFCGEGFQLLEVTVEGAFVAEAVNVDAGEGFGGGVVE